MDREQVDLLQAGSPCGVGRIHEIENALGRELPDDYAEFIMKTGGGTLSAENCVIKNILARDGTYIECKVDNIFGNGTLPRGISNDLDGASISLMSDWEISTDFLLIAVSESGMRECFLMNYYYPDIPKYSIIFVESDVPDEGVVVADSFTEFLEKLEPR